MSCYHPLKGFRTALGVVFSQLARTGGGDSIELPCGRCIGCRMRRASDWSLRVMHESQLWSQNCFLTLTYGTGRLPPNASLEHSDIQKFLKRLRSKYGKEVRYYMCGEYGDNGGRPHYHMCLFNHDFRDRKPLGKSGSGELFYESDSLADLWRHGQATVQDLTSGTASYCARYIMKKTLGDDAEDAYSFFDEDGVIHKRKPPYAAMSLKPGIGAKWLEKYGKTDVFSQDMCIQDGVKRRVPKYYDRVLKRKTKHDVEYKGEFYTYSDLDVLQEGRAALAKLSAEDNTEGRRAVREQVHLAKVRTLTRGL